MNDDRCIICQQSARVYLMENYHVIGIDRENHSELHNKEKVPVCDNCFNTVVLNREAFETWIATYWNKHLKEKTV